MDRLLESLARNYRAHRMDHILGTFRRESYQANNQAPGLIDGSRRGKSILHQGTSEIDLLGAPRLSGMRHGAHLVPRSTRLPDFGAE